MAVSRQRHCVLPLVIDRARHHADKAGLIFRIIVYSST